MICGTCQIDKPESEYTPSMFKKGSNTCRMCTRVNRKKWRYKNSEQEKQRMRDWRAKNLELDRQHKREWHINNPIRSWFLTCKGHAKRRGIEFTLTWEQIEKMWTGRCFETNVEFEMGSNGPLSATMDRIDPKGGYTRNNIRIVTNRVNAIRGNKPLLAVMA